MTPNVRSGSHPDSHFRQPDVFFAVDVGVSAAS